MDRKAGTRGSRMSVTWTGSIHPDRARQLLEALRQHSKQMAEMRNRRVKQKADPQ